MEDSTRPITHTNNGNEQQPVDPKTQQFASNGAGSKADASEDKPIFGDGFLSGLFDDPDFLSDDLDNFSLDESYKQELGFDMDIEQMTPQELEEQTKKCGEYLFKMPENCFLLDDFSKRFTDKKVLLAHQRRLIYLQKTFPLLKHNGKKRFIVMGVTREFGTLGSESANRLDSFHINRIDLSEGYIYKEQFSAIVKDRLRQEEKGWGDKTSSRENAVVQTISHEYGHAFFDSYLNNKINIGKWFKTSELLGEYNMICEEIQEIARRDDPSYKMEDDATGYVKSYGRKHFAYPAEWLAETFANISCGETRSRGAKAMLKWMEEKL